MKHISLWYDLYILHVVIDIQPIAFYAKIV